MNVDNSIRYACELFCRSRFTDCCKLLQSVVNDCRLNRISPRDEVEFIILRNNLLVCDCLMIGSETHQTGYVEKMAELVDVSKLYLYEQHVPLELRVNFVCNALQWYWMRPYGIPDYCYDEVITLVNDCLHEVLYKSGVSTLNSSSLVGNEQDVRNTLERLSNIFLNLEPILVVQCLEMAQVLQLVFLSRRRFASLLVPFAVQSIEKIKTVTQAFKLKKSNCVARCFKLGLVKLNALLDTMHVSSIIASCHVSLCIHYVLDDQFRQALCTLSTADQYVVPDDEIFCLVCYLKAFVNFNLEEFEVTLYYLSQMVNCLMEPFIRSRYYVLLGRTHSKMNNGDLALNAFEQLKETEFHRIMAYYMSQHYEMNNMQFKQIIVLEQTIKEDFVRDEDEDKDFSISYVPRALNILHPKPDLTRRQLLYLAAKKKYELGSYKLAVSSYLSLLKLNDPEQYVSNLVSVPTAFMLKHETVVALIKAREMEEAFKLCQTVIEEFEPGCTMWKSDSFWASELNNYDFNVVGAMLLAETGFNKNPDVVLEALNKSFNCLYAKINCDHQTESSSYNENIKSLRQMLIGKILLLKATILSKLDKDDDCEAAFRKALMYNSGDEDIVYLYSKWLEHKGKISQSMDVRGQFDRNTANKIVCDNVVMIFVLENKHGHDDLMIGGNDLIDDLFANTDDQVMEVNNEMDPADDDIFNDLFLD